MKLSAIIATILSWFALVFIISWISGRKSDNSTFFSGKRNQPWYIVAFAMIGSAMSGVTFVSVPGMVAASAFGYMQMALGFIAGQAVIAFVLVPLFYRMNVISIYSYLEQRFGLSSYRTGAWCFFISKLLGAAVRLFLVCISLQLMLFEPLGLPFVLNVAVCIAVLLLYTYRGGVKSVIWIDFLKTICMVSAIVLSIVFIARASGLELGSLCRGIRDSGMSRMFYFDDPKHPQYFFKQFFGGLFTVVAMTGLDQDMMQRSLACRNFRDAQKNVITSSLLQTVVIFLFLVLGVLLYDFAGANGIEAAGDSLFPAVATSGQLPIVVGVFFVAGLIACSYAAGGSALTALTTSFTLDILHADLKGEEKLSKTRKTVHIAMALALGATIVIFNYLNNTSAIDAVYKLASYTYGPILGMFAFGILTRRQVRDRLVPVVAITAPALCLVLAHNSERWFNGYQFSYELLIVNALLTFLGLIVCSSGAKKSQCSGR